MDPYLYLKSTPPTPGQGFPYLYFEPGISEIGFASVTLEFIDKSISIAVESADGFDTC